MKYIYGTELADLLYEYASILNKLERGYTHDDSLRVEAHNEIDNYLREHYGEDYGVLEEGSVEYVLHNFPRDGGDGTYRIGEAYRLIVSLFVKTT